MTWSPEFTAALVELDLAELARDREDHLEAERRYTLALASLAAEDLRRRVLALRGRGASRYRIGKSSDAVADFSEARRLAHDEGDVEIEIDILLDHATALDWANDASASAALVDAAEALAAAKGVAAHRVRANLLVGRGRTQFRRGSWGEACATLEQAAGEAEKLGSAGYEPLVISLLLLEVVLPNLGRLDEALVVSERVLALTRARGDHLNLASAINNRRNLLVARGQLQAAIADQQQFMEIGRRIGVLLNEYFAEYNIAELLYQAGDAEAAMPHAMRAAGFEESHPAIATRPVASLLKARLFAFQGLVEEARALLQRIEAAVQRARAEGRESGTLAPSEEVLSKMVDLATREASDLEWDQLIARSGRESIEQEPIEVVEMRARTAQRLGKADEARRYFEEALGLAGRIPNLMEPRVRKAASTLVTAA